MLKRRILLFLFLGTILTHAHSQIPGYLGKRFFIEANLSTTPTLFQPSAANKGFDFVGSGALYGQANASFGLNNRFGLQAGYVVGRNKVITLGADYLKTGAIMTAETRSLDPFASASSFDRHYLFYNLHGFTAELGYQKYKSWKGALAPMGRYVAYYVSAGTFKGDILDKQTTFNSDSRTKVHAPLGIDPTYKRLSVGIEWGNRRIIYDRLLLNLAFRLNMGIGGQLLSEEPTIGIYQDDYKLFNQKLFTYSMSNRMASHSLIMIKMGVGLLP